MNYAYSLLINLCIFMILALSLNLIVGYMGRLSLAHAAYVAVGAYGYALATVVLGWGFVPGLLLGVGAAVVLSPLLSLPAFRFRGDFFIMITLAVQVLIQGIVRNWSSPRAELGSWRNLTNGNFGIAGIAKPDIMGVMFDTNASFFALCVVLVLICGMVVFLLTRSPWARLLVCMRDDELVVRGLGKDVRRIKLQVFAISCGIAAIGGVMLAAHVSFIDPSVASLDDSILLLSMLCIGGLGNFKGPVLGAILVLLLPELLRLTPVPLAAAANVRMLAYGLLLLIMIHFRPQGLAGNYRVE